MDFSVNGVVSSLLNHKDTLLQTEKGRKYLMDLAYQNPHIISQYELFYDLIYHEDVSIVMLFYIAAKDAYNQDERCRHLEICIDLLDKVKLSQIDNIAQRFCTDFIRILRNSYKENGYNLYYCDDFCYYLYKNDLITKEQMIEVIYAYEAAGNVYLESNEMFNFYLENCVTTIEKLISVFKFRFQIHFNKPCVYSIKILLSSHKNIQCHKLFDLENPLLMEFYLPHVNKNPPTKELLEPLLPYMDMIPEKTIHLQFALYLYFGGRFTFNRDVFASLTTTKLDNCLYFFWKDLYKPEIKEEHIWLIPFLVMKTICLIKICGDDEKTVSHFGWSRLEYILPFIKEHVTLERLQRLLSSSHMCQRCSIKLQNMYNNTKRKNNKQININKRQRIVRKE